MLKLHAIRLYVPLSTHPVLYFYCIQSQYVLTRTYRRIGHYNHFINRDLSDILRYSIHTDYTIESVNKIDKKNFKPRKLETI